MKTTKTISKKDIKRNWHHFNAKDKVLGKLAAEISQILMGKHKVDYSPNMEMGDKVVVTNSKDIGLSGAKEDKKIYYRHSSQVGNLRKRTVKQMREHNPSEIIRLAVKGMLPNNRLRDTRLANLRIFEGEDHPHRAQIGGK